ncbi:MAG: UTP--glucose-1-phosphate uridylyltransferase [Candidatus Anammoxibacter sp.]
MSKANDKFRPFAKRMVSGNLPDIVIRTFERYYRQLVMGDTGLIAENDIIPIESLPDVETFPPELRKIGKSAMAFTVLLKLNGGLGTGMGLDRAKSSLIVKDDFTFLDIIANQAICTGTPLVLMNSFATHDDSIAILKQHPKLRKNIPHSFLQHKVPKITQEDLSPAVYKKDAKLEWCPPGHGDIYTALVTSGMLNKLLEAGYKFAFISNADNLGAVLDECILGYFVENKLSFMMEVADRTLADRKGGHLARTPDGKLILRESAQCSSADKQSFQDTTVHKYFNTNSIWINLQDLQNTMIEKDNILDLPMICNRKTVEPGDAASTPVFQIETAIGAAISIFKRAAAVRVPRCRFAPVKTTDDLLAVRSDAYVLTDDFRITANPARELGQIIINLDSTYYKMIDRMESRFPYNLPSLVGCEELSVKGDILFGKDVTIKGKVNLVNNSSSQIKIEDNKTIESN